MLKGERFFGKREKPLEIEPLERLEEFRKGLEVTLKTLEATGEKESLYVKRQTERPIWKAFYGLTGGPERIFFKMFFPKWRREFWEAEKRYAQIPSPENGIEQSVLFNSNQAPLEGKVFDGFKLQIQEEAQKQRPQIIRGPKDLNEEGILPFEKRGSEVIVVDRTKDKKLNALCKWARGLKEKVPDEEKRIFIIGQKVFEKMGVEVQGSREKEEETRERMERKEEILLGDIKSGLCWHRSLLFQVLAREAGIKSRMPISYVPVEESVFGTMAASRISRKTEEMIHLYNQVSLENGEIVIVDLSSPLVDPVEFVRSHKLKWVKWKDFKQLEGGFPRFGSNALPFPIYQDVYGRFQGGWLGAPGLKELLKPD